MRICHLWNRVGISTRSAWRLSAKLSRRRSKSMSACCSNAERITAYKPISCCMKIARQIGYPLAASDRIPKCKPAQAGFFITYRSDPSIWTLVYMQCLTMYFLTYWFKIVLSKINRVNTLRWNLFTLFLFIKMVHILYGSALNLWGCFASKELMLGHMPPFIRWLLFATGCQLYVAQSDWAEPYYWLSYRGWFCHYMINY